MQRYRQFDAQVRFVLSAKLKNRLYREAARRRMSAADLLRESISSQGSTRPQAGSASP